MPIHLSRHVGVAAAALLLASAGAAQAQGKSHGHDKGHGNEHARAGDHDSEQREHDARRDGGVYGEHDQHTDARVDPRYDPRNDRRDDPRYDPRYGRDDARRVPPGLAKKPGGMPPGQYKKMYGADQGAGVLRDVLGRRGYQVTRSSRVGESEYVYYRTRDGGLHRAMVSPGADRLQFGNVPSSLLSEVLARLY